MNWQDRRGEASLIPLGALAIAFTVGGAVVLDWSGLQHLRFSVMLAVLFVVCSLVAGALIWANITFQTMAASVAGISAARWATSPPVLRVVTQYVSLHYAEALDAVWVLRGLILLALGVMWTFVLRFVILLFQGEA